MSTLNDPQKSFVDWLYDYLMTHESRLPDFGWFTRDEVFRAAPRDLVPKYSARGREGLDRILEDLDDERFEGQYGRVRLVRPEPYPIEIDSKGELRLLLAMCQISNFGARHFTEADLADILESSVTNAYQRTMRFLREHPRELVRVGKRQYKLNASPDSVLYVETRYPRRSEYRFSTIGQELAAAEKDNHAEVVQIGEIELDTMIEKDQELMALLQATLEGVSGHRAELLAMKARLKKV